MWCCRCYAEQMQSIGVCEVVDKPAVETFRIGQLFERSACGDVYQLCSVGDYRVVLINTATGYPWTQGETLGPPEKPGYFKIKRESRIWGGDQRDWWVAIVGRLVVQHTITEDLRYRVMPTEGFDPQ